MKKMDELGLWLCKYQGKLFEESIGYEMQDNIKKGVEILKEQGVDYARDGKENK